MESVKITLDKERTIQFDFNAIVRAEEAAGHSFASPDSFTAKGFRYGDLRALLWAGLTGEDPDLQIEDVGNLIVGANLAKVSKAVLGALRPFFGVKSSGSGPSAG